MEKAGHSQTLLFLLYYVRKTQPESSSNPTPHKKFNLTHSHKRKCDSSVLSHLRLWGVGACGILRHYVFEIDSGWSLES